MAQSTAHKRWLIITALLLVTAAAAAGIWLMRGTSRSSLEGRPVPTPDFDSAAAPISDSAQATRSRPGDVTITLPPDKLENAHLKIEEAVARLNAASDAGGLRTTGTVQSNAYKEVPVLPVAGGIVREVNVALGDQVRRGQRVAAIFSTELAEAQTAYLGLQAEIERHHQHYHRTGQLVELGAVSREEFEAAQAEYKTEQAKLAAARQRLMFLGMSAKQVEGLRAADQMSAMISVDAPAAGTVLSRTVNVGEVVMTGKELFRIADLSTVWVIGQIYERDFASVRAGTPAAITAPAFPGRTFNGRVSYVDPRVDPQMRTAQVRVEVGNPGGMLKLGMFVDIYFGGAAKAATTGQPAVSVPLSAVQMIGTKQVVFIATDQSGTFVQREVNAGAEANGSVPVYAGLSAGERVVTEGSFLLRSESVKLNPAQLTTSPTRDSAGVSQAPAKESSPSPHNKTQPQSVTVTLAEGGYQPASFTLKRAVPARVTFVRKVEATCGTEIVLEEYGIKRELPLNQPVVVEFTPSKMGEFKFACGMDMLRGKILVR